MFYRELAGNSLDAYNKMVSKLLDRASKELGLARESLVVRPLRPEDLTGGTTPAWSLNCTSASAWNTVISSVSIADARFVGISGVFHGEATGEATQVLINREASDVRFWDVTPIRSFDTKVGYADDPVTIDQNTTLTVKIYCTTASTLVDFGFFGAVVEKYGILVSPTK